MKDARTILKEWFLSKKNRPLSLEEKKLLMNTQDYLRLYREVEREVQREKTLQVPSEEA